MLTSQGKVLVTGGAGFIGSHQVDALIKSGFKVAVVDDLSTGEESNINPKATFYNLDIRDPELADVFRKEKPDYVFHFAAQISVNNSVKDPVFDADVNIIGSLNLLDNCVEFGVKKILFSSTGGALYGEAETVPTPEEYPCNPISPYGIAKLTVENYLRFYKDHYGLDYGINRYSNVYGPRQNTQGEAGVIAIFIEKFLQGKHPVIHGDGHQTRDFIYVEDVVRANMQVFESEVCDTYNVATGRQTTINEVFKYIVQGMNKSVKEKYSTEFSGQEVSCLSYDKIKNELNWEPQVKVEEGIEKTIEWFDQREFNQE